MRVCLICEEGTYGIRAFRRGYDVGAYVPPPEWDAQAIEIPDAVVAAFAATSAQLSVIEMVLARFDNDNYERTHPPA